MASPERTSCCLTLKNIKVSMCALKQRVLLGVFFVCFLSKRTERSAAGNEGRGGNQTCQASGDICIILQDGGLVDGLI